MTRKDWLDTINAPLGRRDFLTRSGRIMAGAVAASGAFQLAACGKNRADAFDPAPAVFASSAPPDLADRMKTLVAELESRFPYATALYTRDSAVTINADVNGVTVSSTGPLEGVVLTVFDGKKMIEEATSFTTGDGMERAAKRLMERPAIAPPGLDIQRGDALEKSWSEAGRIDAASVPLPEQVERARKLQKTMQGKASDIINASLSTSTGIMERLFVSRNRALHQTIGRASVGASIMRGGGGGRPGVFWMRRSGAGGLELTELDEAEIAELVERAGRLKGAQPIEPGETTVVSEPDVTGTLAHESFGHGVEVDMFAHGRARAAEYLGRSVGSPLIRIVDDPTKATGNGYYHFDDEGWNAAPTLIVENGVFRSGLSDFLSARTTGQPRTANGRRESFDHKTYSRMSNTFFAPGTTPVDQLIGEVKQGVLIGRFRAGMEDPKGWGIQIVSQYGEEIRNGKLTGKVYSPVTLSGFVPDVLASVDAVGNDFRLGTGTCGKGSKESVAVGMGGPHLRFRARVS